MPVLRDLSIQIDRNEVIRRQFRREPTEAMLAMVDWAIERAATLAEPKVAYEIYRSEGVEGEDLVLEGGRRLKLGPHADLAAPAEQVIVSLTTIGPAVEAEVRQLMGGSEPLRGYLLDCAGVVAVGRTGMHLRDMVEGMVKDKGWGVSPSLYPGSPMGWSVKGQRDLVALLPAAEIGVSLTSSCMLVPQKSSSGLVGIGPGYDQEKVGTLCHWCALAESCWRRRRSARGGHGEGPEAHH